MTSTSTRRLVRPNVEFRERGSVAHRVAGVGRPEGLLALTLITGLVLRVLLIRSGLGRVDSDEAVGMLMARHAAHGHLSTFFLGCRLRRDASADP